MYAGPDRDLPLPDGTVRTAVENAGMSGNKNPILKYEGELRDVSDFPVSHIFPSC